jgi:hypothetical protein
MRRPEGTLVGAGCAACVGGNERKARGKAREAGDCAGVSAFAEKTQQRFAARHSRREIEAFNASDGHYAPNLMAEPFPRRQSRGALEAPLLRMPKAQNPKSRRGA